MSNGVICKSTLGAHVDSEILNTSFAPVAVPKSKLVENTPPVDPFGTLGGFFPFGAKGRMAQALRSEYSLALEATGVALPTLKEFTQLIEVKAANGIADLLRLETEKFAKQEAPRHYREYARHQFEQARENARDDGETLLKARNTLDAMGRLELKERKRLKIFEPGFVGVKSPQRKTEEPLVPINEIGILFLERLRIRPLGHALERAPFFQLTIEPRETVTLRQKSFSKRAASFESTLEESEEKQLEYSSTFTTELAEEYAYTTSQTESVGLSHTGQFQYGTAAKGQITASHTGDYGASTTDSRTDTDSVREAQTITRRVATTQKTLHRTVVSVATEDSLEAESIRVIENTDTRTRKILMRRVMQVLHLSYERYGARFCWAPCLQEPGRDVRRFVPGEEFFAAEIEAIRDRWSTAPPPEELGPGPLPKEVCTDWTGRLGGGVGGMRADYMYSLVIPDGYLYESAYLELRDLDGSPNVHINQTSLPAANATGVVSISVHVGLSGWPDPENVNYRLCVRAVPGEAINAQRTAAVNAWRTQQAETEIRQFVEEKREELAGRDVNAWPASELMRRIISEFFLDPAQCDCDLVSELELIFEWENLSYRLSAPWWRASTQVNGLQSLRTSFLNASWARVYIPIRPGYEERAITWLMSVGAIPRVPDELEYYLADLRANVLPQYERKFQPGQRDADEIAGSRDIQLTELDSRDWDHEYERLAGFKVLDRWTVTIPTDGVDHETALSRCDAETPLRKAREQVATATAQAVELAAQNVGNATATVSVTVEKP